MNTPEQVAYHREYQREYSRRFPERIRESNRRYGLANRKRLSAQQLAWKHRNPDRVRFYQLKSQHGVTREQYEALLASQGGVCAVCQLPFDKTPAVDHNHETREVRGILHQRCNLAVGWAENPLTENARAYLGRNIYR